MVVSNQTLSLRRVTHIVGAKFVKGLCDLNLLLGVEESIGKLLSFSERAFNDLETGDIAEKVADWLIWISRMRMWVLSCMNTGVAGMAFGRWSVWVLQAEGTESLLTTIDSIGTITLTIGTIHMAGAIFSRGAHGGNVVGCRALRSKVTM